MPKGLYSHHDPHDGALVGYERFTCAPGPSGWRYVAEVLAPDALTPLGTVDLTLDEAGRALRLELRRGPWRVRAGQVGPEARWVRAAVQEGDGPSERLAADPAQPVERAQRADGFAGRSPAFMVATARLLTAGAVGPSAAPGVPRDLRQVLFTEPVLAARTTDTRWTLTEVTAHQTPAGPLNVRAFDVVDLATGERSVAHVAGDVVLAGPGVELEDLSDPPNQ